MRFDNLMIPNNTFVPFFEFSMCFQKDITNQISSFAKNTMTKFGQYSLKGVV